MNAGGNTLKNGLVGWWTLDGVDITNNVIDRSDTGNVGYMINMTTTTARVSGKLGQALRFDGVDDSISFGDPPASLIFNAGQSWTFSHWANIKSLPASLTYVFYAGSRIGNNKLFYMKNSSNFFGFREENLTYHDFTSSTAYIGKWVYLTWVADDSNNITLYINGANPITVSMTSSAVTFKYLGFAYSDTQYGYVGLLDDIRIYNRTLSASEIKSLYNLGADKINSNLMNAGGNTLKNGLVGWWTLDGADIVSNVADRSGTGNTGYLKNFTSTSTAKVSGKLGQALQLDGVDDYVLIGNPSNLNFGTNSFSYGLWVYVTTTVGQYDDALAKGGASTSFPGFDVELGSGPWTTDLTDNTISRSRNYSNTPILGRWVHLFANVDRSSNTLCTFVDGVQTSGACTDISTLGTVSGTSNLVFGRNSNAATLLFKGKIDDIRIYNRTLSASEIKSLYNLGADKINSNLMNAGGNTLKNGLVGWWTLDGADIVSNVADRSGTGNTGYLKNFTSTSTAKVSGKLGQALQLDGVDDYVIGKNIVNASKVTISAWIKINSIPAQSGLIAGFANGIGSISHDKNLYIGTDGKLYFYVYDVGPKTTSAPATTIPLNKWVHVVGVADGTSAKTYIDSVESGTVSAQDTYSSYNVPDIIIGGATGNVSVGGGYFKQKIDDIRVYNRALTPLEIKQLYNLGR